jgi:hypothetical protein
VKNQRTFQAKVVVDCLVLCDGGFSSTRRDGPSHNQLKKGFMTSLQGGHTGVLGDSLQ